MNVCEFLSTIGERRTPNIMDIESRQTRSISNDLTMDNIISQTLASYPKTNRSVLEQWLTLSRYGAIATRKYEMPTSMKGDQERERTTLSYTSGKKDRHIKAGCIVRPQ